jgi:predicted membrane chloride channel (bestrophin family)
VYEALRNSFTTAHSLTGAALGLLLVFRTNSAYARVYDARCIWGQLTNTIREMARLAHTNMQVCAHARMLTHAGSRILTHTHTNMQRLGTYALMLSHVC